MIGNISDSLCYIAEAQFVKSTPKETTVFDTNKIEIRLTKPFAQCKFPEDMKLAGKSMDEIEELPYTLAAEVPSFAYCLYNC